jgi:dTDP-4-dehydrorhamnose 3,5-epimerase
MEFHDEPLQGVRRVQLRRFVDTRGDFVKIFVRSVWEAQGVNFSSAEEYYSRSGANVIRGMHFQVPPHDHDKVVYCVTGVVEDVLLDLRKGGNYGCHYSLMLSADEPTLLFIPKGIAHGFKSFTDGSLMVYKTSTEYAPEHDRGIRWDSFGYDWKCPSPIISERDQSHPALANFNSPF